MQYNTSCKRLNEISTPTDCFLPLCGKGNVNDPKEDVKQAVGHMQIAKYPEYKGVKIPSTRLQTLDSLI